MVLPHFPNILLSCFTFRSQEKEILSEKIRAIITRNKARDLFDAFALMKKGVKIDNKLVAKKLVYNNLKFSKKQFSEAINNKQKIWMQELKPLLNNVPEFNLVRNFVLNNI